MFFIKFDKPYKLNTYLVFSHIQTRKKFKFTEEGRYSLGFAVVEDENGEKRGVRLDIFDYSGKNIIGFKKERELINNEINRAKHSDPKCKRWWYDPRDGDDRVWEEDPVTMLKSVGPKTADKLKKANITVIKHLSQLTTQTIQTVSSTTGVPERTLSKLVHMAATDTEPGAYPHEKQDLRKHTNPYQAKYGDNWRTEISRSKDLKDTVSVRDLIRHIDNATRKAFEGTKYADSYLWSHDSLEAFANRETLEWMEQQDLLKRWIRPQCLVLMHKSLPLTKMGSS